MAGWRLERWWTPRNVKLAERSTSKEAWLKMDLDMENGDWESQRRVSAVSVAVPVDPEKGHPQGTHKALYRALYSGDLARGPVSLPPPTKDKAAHPTFETVERLMVAWPRPARQRVDSLSSTLAEQHELSPRAAIICILAVDCSCCVVRAPTPRVTRLNSIVIKHREPPCHLTLNAHAPVPRPAHAPCPPQGPGRVTFPWLSPHIGIGGLKSRLRFANLPGSIPPGPAPRLPPTALGNVPWNIVISPEASKSHLHDTHLQSSSPIAIAHVIPPSALILAVLPVCISDPARPNPAASPPANGGARTRRRATIEKLIGRDAG
ncbi:hypothetical protein G7046_g98 [Stylonectria norvegica]|nr:hypothetical protein G7046_g98 [Stylonectria norvegica]